MCQPNPSTEGPWLRLVGTSARLANLLGCPPPMQVALSPLLGFLDAQNALSAAYQSRPVLLGFDRLPPPFGSRLRAHAALATSGLTGQGPIVVRPS